MNDAVSVVIPAFNYGRYLGAAIQSVLSQTFQNFELLVIDDGSTDDTRKILSRFTDSRLRYVYQFNQGLSAARNTGIANARFDFVAFLDADDLWLPGMLESAVERFSRLSPDYGLVACNSLRINQAGELIDLQLKHRPCSGEQEYRAADILIKSRFMPSTVVVRAEVFQTVGLFDTSLRSSEDRDMWIRIASKYRIHYLSTPLVHIRKHATNMSRNADRMRVNMRRVLAKHSRAVAGLPGNWGGFLQAYSFHYFEVGWMYYDEGRIPEAIAQMLKSWVAWPLFVAPARNLGQPPLFRLRALARFLLGLLNK